MRRGLFISFEGIEGCGKSTQARRLTEAVRAAGRDVLLAREPGGTPIAEKLRAVLLDPAHAGMPGTVELLLLAAGRADHVQQVLAPALGRGTHVICDRFSDSTLAYQGAARGLDEKLVRQVDQAARGTLVPDLTLLLDLPAELALTRARSRNARRPESAAESRLDDEDIAFHRRVRSGYLRLAGEEPRRIWVVDASGDVEDVSRRVDSLIRRALPGLVP